MNDDSLRRDLAAAPPWLVRALKSQYGWKHARRALYDADCRVAIVYDGRVTRRLDLRGLCGLRR